MLLLFFIMLFLHFNLSFSSYDIDSLTTSQVITLVGKSTSDYLGYSVNSAGDINKDGYEDFLVGAAGYDTYRGAVYVVYGKSTLSDIDLSSQSLNPSTTGFTITGSTQGDYLGNAVSTAGDINGDGYDDIIIGAQKALSQRGAAYIIYGQPTASFTNIDLSSTTLDPATTGFMISGASSSSDGERLGWAVATAGKFNEDKYDDIVIGAYIKNSYAGGAYIIYGKATNTNIDLSSTTLDPASTGLLVTGTATSQLGIAVGFAGDFNNDGYNDVILGANRYNSYQGAAYIIYGNKSSSLSNIALSTTTLNPASTGVRIFGKATGTRFARAVNTAGDINGDGYNDVIIGAYYTTIGAVYVIYGGSSSTRVHYDLSKDTLDPQSTGFVITGSTSGFYLGTAVGTAGDLDSDGYDDIIFASSGSSSSTTGIGYVVYGKPTEDLVNIDLSTTTLDPSSTGFMVTGVAIENQLAYTISAGDFNNDGKPELIFGAYYKLSNRGKAYVMYPSQICSLDNCEECSSADRCKSCSTGVELFDNNTCGGCLTGYYSDSGSCLVCPEECSECTSSTVCQACNDGYTLLDSFTCSVQCLTGYYLDNGSCKECTKGCSECTSKTVCQACDDGYTLLDSFTCSAECLTGYYLDNGSCKVCPEGCSECTSATVCQACYSGYTLLDSQLCLSQSYSTAALNTTGTSLEGTSILTSFLTPGSSLPVIFGLVAKLIRNTKYLDIHVSNTLQVERFAWKTGSSFLSAPASWKSKSESNPLPEVFSQYAMEPVFLINYWKPLIMTIGGLICFIIFKSLSNSLKKKKKSWQTTTRTVSIIASNFALTQFYSNLDDVLFFLILDVRSAIFDTALRYASVITGILLLIIVIIGLGLHLIVLKRYQRHKKLQQLQDFLYKYEPVKLLFRDYKDDSLFQQTFLLLHVTRATISNLVTTALFEYPVLQTSILTICSVCIIIFLLIKRPFKGIVSTLGQYFCEMILLMAFVSMLVMAIFDSESLTQPDSVEKLSQLIIIVNMILFYSGMAFMLCGIIKNFYDSYKTKRKTKALQTRNLANNELRIMNNKPEESYEIENKNFPQSFSSVKVRNYHNEGQNIFIQESHIITKTAIYSQNPSINNTNFDPQINPRGGYFNPVNRFLNSLPRQQSLSSDSQMDDSLNTSNTNLLSNPITSAISGFAAASNLQNPRRGKIKMPEGYYQRRDLIRNTQENGQERIGWGNNESIMSTQVDPQRPLDQTKLPSGTINPADVEEFLRRRESPQQKKHRPKIRRFRDHQ